MSETVLEIEDIGGQDCFWYVYPVIVDDEKRLRKVWKWNGRPYAYEEASLFEKLWYFFRIFVGFKYPIMNYPRDFDMSIYEAPE